MRVGALVLTGAVLCGVGLICSTFVIVHAFRRSVGTGVMVLFVPFYVVYYAFSQFEHRSKGLLLAGWLGCLIPGVVMVQTAVAAGAPRWVEPPTIQQ